MHHTMHVLDAPAWTHPPTHPHIHTRAHTRIFTRDVRIIHSVWILSCNCQQRFFTERFYVLYFLNKKHVFKVFSIGVNVSFLHLYMHTHINAHMRSHICYIYTRRMPVSWFGKNVQSGKTPLPYYYNRHWIADVRVVLHKFADEQEAGLYQGCVYRPIQMPRSALTLVNRCAQWPWCRQPINLCLFSRIDIDAYRL